MNSDDAYSVSIRMCVFCVSTRGFRVPYPKVGGFGWVRVGIMIGCWAGMKVDPCPSLNCRRMDNHRRRRLRPRRSHLHPRSQTPSPRRPQSRRFPLLRRRE